VSELPSYPRGAAEREEAQATPEAQFEYAGWWRRAGALVIDNILVLVPSAVFLGLAFVPEETIAVIAILLFLVSILVLPFVYFTLFHGRFGNGQTIGKRALGIRVQHERGEQLSYGAAFGRYAIVFAFNLFTLPVILDYLFPLWDRRNQSLHDKVASSIVVRA
jgi:uncharacterized RDD family membrane protein YckC